MASVTDLFVELQNGTTDTLFATWSFPSKYAKNLDKYKVTWTYATGNGVAFSGSSSDQTSKVSTYTIPSNATKVKVTVKPVSKTYKKKGKTTSYWTGTASSVTYLMVKSKPEKASVPTVTVVKYKLTAVIDNNADKLADKIEFYVVKGNAKFTSSIVSINKTNRASFSCNLDVGGKYRVRCRAINTVSSNPTVTEVYAGYKYVYGEWSEYSSEVSTAPAPISISSVKPDNETSVKLTLKTGNANLYHMISALEKMTNTQLKDKVNVDTNNASSYEVQYTTEKKYFDTSSDVSSDSIQTKKSSVMQNIYITGLETGKAWYFRARAINDQGESDWSEVKSATIGTEPSAPTTWSLTTTAMVGDKVTLCWTHNSEDNSKQSAAQIELIVNGKSEVVRIYTPESEETKDDENPVYSHELNTSKYNDGAEIKWRVRTKGIIDTYSDWSIQRTINVHAPATVQVHIGTDDYLDTGILPHFPYPISVHAGPNSQLPVSYNFSIVSNDTYMTEDATGTEILVTKGTEVFSYTVNTSQRPLSIELHPSNITLENNQSYTLTVTVSMNSGLLATAKEVFEVEWSDDRYIPDAGIAIDENTLSAYISPYCEDDNGVLIDSVTLSVYRREYDGRLTEIATGLPNDGAITVTDPHPSLNYARYRIVASSKTTSMVGYEDLPGEPVGEPSIVIQWDEKWIEYESITDEEVDEPETPSVSGSMIRLPYNVDTSESSSLDVSLIEYIGRENPVSYYGTQKGEGGNWSAEIDKADKETIFALRRLSKYAGDVYVREPSGVGYWANITVSMDIKHLDLTVPIKFDVKRVEGGI